MGVFGMAFSYLGFAVAHFLQFVLALTVIGLYGQDLQSANKAHVYADGKWVYAVVVGALSALTALLFLVPFILRLAHVWVWGYILFILWIALFGLFGSMFIKERAEGDAGVQRMKNAVWVDLANALLWLISSTASVIYWLSHRERHTRFTSRATV